MARWKDRPQPKRRTGRASGSGEVLLALPGITLVRRNEPQLAAPGVPIPVLVSLDPSVSAEDAAAGLRLAADELDPM